MSESGWAVFSVILMPFWAWLYHGSFSQDPATSIALALATTSALIVIISLVKEFNEQEKKKLTSNQRSSR